MKQVNLALGYSEVEISSKNRIMTYQCRLQFTGYSDCEISILIPGSNSITIPAGEIKIIRRLDWFDERRVLKILSRDCSEESKLLLTYKFD